MKADVVLGHLEAAAEQLSVKVSYEQLQAMIGHGGLCKVKGQYRVIIDKRATTAERIQTLATALARFPTDVLDLPAAVRDVIAYYDPTIRRPPQRKSA